MCGISGIINTNGFALNDLRKMTQVISHRGPDDEGFVVFKKIDSNPLCLGSDDTSSESLSTSLPYQPTELINSMGECQFAIGFGHRRLSILDLSANGHQPMCSREGNLWITYNGEIYNYFEIRKELIQLGHQFISSSDTEVILYAYKQWGCDCLNKFIGMWSFAIYDSRAGEIFMARDRYGIKPLYYWFSPHGDFCFGSEIKQFTVLNGWKAKLNGQRAYDYLVYSLTDHTNETMFKGVYHIPGGYYLKCAIESIFDCETTKQLKLTAWYKTKQNPYTGSFSEACTKFEELFTDSVKLHLRSDVPIGTALSGGLDSSAIVCELNNLLKSEGKANSLKTFSSCSEDERYDERKWIDIVVRYTKVDAHFVYPTFENLFRLTPQILWHQDEPYQSQSVFFGYHIFELARKNNIKVLLNGQGADEYLGGYEQFRTARNANLVKARRWTKLYNEIRHDEKFALSKILKESAKIIHHFFPENLKNATLTRVGQIKRASDTVDLNKIGAERKHPNDQIPIKFNTVAEISQHFTFHSNLPKFLRWEDRNSMAHSIEARVPFLDHRLVEFVYDLPVEYLDDRGETKKVLRSGLKDILPFEISRRKDKKGFITPEERWVKEVHTNTFRCKLEQSIQQLNGIVKPGALTYFDNIVKGKLTFNYYYWRLIMLAEWVKLFNVDTKK